MDEYIEYKDKSKQTNIEICEIKDIEGSTQMKKNCDSRIYSTLSTNYVAETIRYIEEGDENSVQWIMKENSNENTQDLVNRFLHVAVEAYRTNIVKLLLLQKADINSKDDDGNTPLHKAVEKIYCLDLVKIIVNSGADFNVRNNRNMTAFDLAEKVTNDLNPTRNDKLLLIKNILKVQGVKPDIKENDDISSSIVNNSYPCSKGLKVSLIGEIYQARLLILFAKRAVDKNLEFSLATEIVSAGKFDDVFIKYTHQGVLFHRFVQVKHKAEKIKDRDLFSGNIGSDFNIIKYFISFCDITENMSENHASHSGVFKEFTVCTNANFEIQRNDFFETIKLNAEDFLYFENDDAKILKLKDNTFIEQTLLKGFKKHKENRCHSEEFIKSKISNFIRDFSIVTNYPDIEKLGNLLIKEFGDKFRLLDGQFLIDSFEKKMLQWVRSYNGEEMQAFYFSQKDACTLFSYISEMVNNMFISGASRQYRNEIRQYKINFKPDQENIICFMQSKNKILHVVSKCPRLSLIKLENSLPRSSCYFKNIDSVIYTSIKSLTCSDTSKCILTSFASDVSHNYLVIECPDYDSEIAIDLLNKLKDILHRNDDKKIIIISHKLESLIINLKHGFDSRYVSFSDKTDFKDLDELSKDHILAKNIIFQENIGISETKVKMHHLIDKLVASVVIVDELLWDIVKSDHLSVGDSKAFQSEGFNTEYFLRRKLHNQILDVSTFLKNEIFIFFLTGISKEDLTAIFNVKFGRSNILIQYWDSTATFSNGIILSSCERDENSYDTIFKGLYTKYSNVAWVCFQNNLFLLKRYKSKESLSLPNFIVPNHVYLQYQSIYPEELVHKVVLVASDAGQGKSTMLTGLAHGLKKYNPYTWIIRIDLNDYAVDDEASVNLKKIDSKLDEKEKNIEMLTTMAIKDNLMEPSKRLQREILKTALGGGSRSNMRVIFMIDGFDEISPNYKNQACMLIKSLASSNVAQLWVTTRDHLKTYLEIELDTCAYILTPLTHEEQVTFLSRYLKNQLRFYRDSNTGYTIADGILTYLNAFRSQIEQLLDMNEITKKDTLIDLRNLLSGIDDILESGNKDIEIIQTSINELNMSVYTNVLLFLWNSSIGDYNFGVEPLNLRLLADYLFHRKLQIPIKVQILDLYRMFIDSKIKIYHNIKSITNSGNISVQENRERDCRKIREMHCDLAKGLFLQNRKDICKSKKLSKYKFEEMSRIGLVKINGDSLQFIHRTYAEYFISEWLYRNLRKKYVQDEILVKVLYDDHYSLIRRFLNGLLQSNEKTFSSLKSYLKLSFGQIFSSTSSSSFQVGSQVVHIWTATGVIYRAVLENNHGIVRLLDGIFKNNFQLKTWFRAIERVCFVGYINKYNYLITEIEDGSLAGSYDYNVFDLNESHELFYSYNYPQPNFSNALRDGVYNLSKSINTVLHIAQDQNMVKILLDAAEREPTFFQELLLAKDLRKRTALYDAHDENIARLLLERTSKYFESGLFENFVLSEDENSQTILHVVSSDAILKTIIAMVQPYEDILKQLFLHVDTNGCTALHLSVLNRSLWKTTTIIETVKDKPYLLEAMLTCVDSCGRNALSLASLNGHSDALAFLLMATQKYSDFLGKIVDTFDYYKKNILHNAMNGEIVEVVLRNIADKPDLVKKIVLEDQFHSYHGLPGLLHYYVEGANRFHHLNQTAPQSTCTIKVLLQSIKDEEIFKEMVLSLDQFGWTALHRAAASGHIDLIVLILDGAGVFPETLKELIEVRDKSGKTALDIASAGGHDEICNLITECIASLVATVNDDHKHS